MSSLVRTIQKNEFKRLGYSRDRDGTADTNPTFGHILDANGESVGRHFPRALPRLVA